MPRSSTPRVSLERIAQEVGVSVATVSRVLNGRPGISEPVRERVGKALEQYSYRRRTTRRSTAGAQTQTVGFVVTPKLFSHIRQGDEFYGRHLYAVQNAITEAGFYPLLITDEQDTDRSGRLRCVVERRVQAIIAESWHFDLLARTAREVPVVLFNRVSSRIDSVCTNMRLAAQAQLQALYDLGHRSMALFRLPQDAHSWENIDYWQQYHTFVALNGLPCPRAFLQPVHFTAGGEEAAAEAFVKRVVAAGATALLTYDSYAPYLYRALEGMNLRVPEDITLVGFNDLHDPGSGLPPLTTYRQDFEALGREAMRLIIERVQPSPSPVSTRSTLPDAAAVPPRLVQLPGQLVTRATTAPPRDQ